MKAKQILTRLQNISDLHFHNPIIHIVSAPDKHFKFSRAFLASQRGALPKREITTAAAATK